MFMVPREELMALGLRITRYMVGSGGWTRRTGIHIAAAAPQKAYVLYTFFIIETKYAVRSNLREGWLIMVPDHDKRGASE